MQDSDQLTSQKTGQTPDQSQGEQNPSMDTEAKPAAPSYSGYMVHPDGSRLSVHDKWAYYQQFPETYFSTTQSIDRLAVYKDRVQAAGLQRDEARAQAVQQGEPAHGCINRYVVKSCPECHGVNSAYVDLVFQLGTEANRLASSRFNNKSRACDRCGNTGRVEEPCARCVADREQSAGRT